MLYFGNDGPGVGKDRGGPHVKWSVVYIESVKLDASGLRSKLKVGLALCCLTG